MAKLEVYFMNGRSAKLDPNNVCFTGGPYQRFDDLGTTEEAKLLTAGGAIVNWHAVSFIRLTDEREEEE